MYKNFTQCENWEDVLNLVIQLTNENEQLKSEKQLLNNELTNLLKESKTIMGDPFAAPKIVKLIEEVKVRNEKKFFM